MITTTLTNNLKQSRKIIMILDGGVKINKVLPQISEYHPKYHLDTILETTSIIWDSSKWNPPHTYFNK
jgi:hypothetical protein